MREITNLEKNIRNKVVDLADKLEVLVLRKVLESEFTLSGVTGICLSQHCVTLTWNNLSTLKGRPDILLNSSICRLLANLRLHLAKPHKNFLISEAVEGTSEAIESSGVGKERVR